jgi:putative membrane protein
MVTTSTDRIRPEFRKSPLLISLAVIYTLVFIWSAINPLHPADWRLENVLSILFVTLLILTYKKFPLSDLSYILITLFMILHTIGSHYTYAEVPFGFWLQETFDFSRNHSGHTTSPSM